MKDNENTNNKNENWYDIVATSLKNVTIVTLLVIFFCYLCAFIDNNLISINQIRLIFYAIMPYFIVSSISYSICLIYKVIRHSKITFVDLLIVIISMIFLLYYYSISTNYATIQAKPIIYLYPESATKVNVKLGNPELITCSYPEYNKEIGWNIFAEPNGNLNMENKNLYALYWEGNSKYNKKIENDGFIVKGEDTSKFLEEKLKCLGLTDREAEEFIVYWLPQMEDNKYNYIRFETKEEIEKNMPLNIEPTPDTIIRVMMDWCEISSERKARMLQSTIAEQVIETPERRGFVVVEWGGTEIGSFKIK